MSEKLALLGGSPAVTKAAPDLRWPVITDEDRQAVLRVLEARSMSDWKLTTEFEREYAAWIGQEHALAYSTGTGAIHGAMFGLGWGHGDEVITPTWTYWGTHAQLLNVHAVPIFCDIDPHTLCLGLAAARAARGRTRPRGSVTTKRASGKIVLPGMYHGPRRRTLSRSGAAPPYAATRSQLRRRSRHVPAALHPSRTCPARGSRLRFRRVMRTGRGAAALPRLRLATAGTGPQHPLEPLALRAPHPLLLAHSGRP
ncbi:MAG: aminotransferase class I/II-fold pyridoxal phosphate-dependent enzyme [Armatimonadetes bacterium]|nr:aminotransferase class I/II-fold pyridoxal phosphate-dependent enzyme [Armatimonadota bacterium]